MYPTVQQYSDAGLLGMLKIGAIALCDSHNSAALKKQMEAG